MMEVVVVGLAAAEAKVGRTLLPFAIEGESEEGNRNLILAKYELILSDIDVKFLL